MIVFLQLTTAGVDSGPFDLYSNLDGYDTPFEENVSRDLLVAGYSTTVPDNAITVRITSKEDCISSVDITLRDVECNLEGYTGEITTTTSTSTSSTTSTSTSSTTTTTTTSALACLGYTISSNNPLSSATVNFIECNGDAGSLSVGFGTGFDSFPFCAKDGQYTVVGDGTVSYTGDCTHTYLLSSPGKSSRTLACAETTYPLTVYSYTFPMVDGTILYTNNTGGVLSTPVTGGDLWYQNFIDTLTFQIGNDGVVSNVSFCV